MKLEAVGRRPDPCYPSLREYVPLRGRHSLVKVAVAVAVPALLTPGCAGLMYRPSGLLLPQEMEMQPGRTGEAREASDTGSGDAAATWKEEHVR